MTDKVSELSDEGLQQELVALGRYKREKQAKIDRIEAEIEYLTQVQLTHNEQLGDTKFLLGSVRNELKKRGQINE